MSTLVHYPDVENEDIDLPGFGGCAAACMQGLCSKNELQSPVGVHPTKMRETLKGHEEQDQRRNTDFSGLLKKMVLEERVNIEETAFDKQDFPDKLKSWREKVDSEQVHEVPRFLSLHRTIKQRMIR
ncbi:hypothetical protein E5288_WYG018740 [Bos mutus]|uniref:Uncharacterized protein n=1 Tax=Bos mutus TaxID=72004 RepID=A0A6B0R2K5_9CETA|nr:hypothetical protein [Bos mutus]